MHEDYLKLIKNLEVIAVHMQALLKLKPSMIPHAKCMIDTILSSDSGDNDKLMASLALIDMLLVGSLRGAEWAKKWVVVKTRNELGPVDGRAHYVGRNLHLPTCCNNQNKRS